VFVDGNSPCAEAMTAPMNAPVYDRILLTRLKFIGDIVLTTPLLRSVRHAFPRAYIAYLGDAGAVPLLEKNPHLDEILAYDFRRPSWREQMRVVRELRRRRFDLVIDLFGNPRSALLSGLSGARVRVGPDRSGRGLLYTHRVKDDGVPKSAVAFHNQSLRAAGIEPLPDVRTEVILDDRERGDAAAILRADDARGPGIVGGRPLLALHPGATWPAKRWPAERFAQLAERFRTATGGDVVVTAGPGDTEAVAAVRSALSRPVKVLQGLPLRGLAAAMSCCSVVVSNDCGPMHIAVAVGTPTIGLFGPGEEDIWFPYLPVDNHRALRQDVPCHPCHLDFCNRTGDGYMECMKKLEVEEVTQAVLKALERKNSPPIR
jgi:lipopolysaccharide heptosyltransferase II